MIVEVKLFAMFREGRFANKQIELPDGCQLGELLKHLKISAKEVGILLVNGSDAPAEQKLSSEDVVSVFPLIGGG